MRACLPRREDVDEVIQNVSLIAWRKFSLLREPEQFARWACLIARYEILKYRRTKARDRLVLDEDIMEKISEEGIPEIPLRHRQLAALDGCVAKLPQSRRDLVTAAYAPQASMKKLASDMGRSEGSVYQLLARIRQELAQCVEHTLAQEAPGA